MSLRSIEGKRTKKRNLELEVAQLRERLDAKDEAIDKLSRQLAEVVRAVNASSIVVNCFETFLDEKHPGWDGGNREAIARRSDLLKERKRIALAVATELEPEKRVELSERLFTISREVGTEAVDIPLVVANFVKARDLVRAKQIVTYAREAKVELEEVHVRNFEQLERRIGELEKQADSE